MSSLLRWRKLIAEGQFARLEVVPALEVDREGLVVEVACAAIRVQRGFDAELLESIVTALSTRGPR